MQIWFSLKVETRNNTRSRILNKYLKKSRKVPTIKHQNGNSKSNHNMEDPAVSSSEKVVARVPLQQETFQLNRYLLVVLLKMTLTYCKRRIKTRKLPAERKRKFVSEENRRNSSRKRTFRNSLNDLLKNSRQRNILYNR